MARRARSTWRRFVTLQAQYSLLVRDLEREHVPLCREKGLGILPWSPLAGGFLTGKYERGKPPPADARLGAKAERFARYDNERNWKILDAVRAVASEIELDAVGGQPRVAAREAAGDVGHLRRAHDRAARRQPRGRRAQADRGAGRELDEATAFELGYPYKFIAQTQGIW